MSNAPIQGNDHVSTLGRGTAGDWGVGLLVIGSLSLCLLVTYGCTAVGVAAHVIGPPPVQPRYVPEKTPMLVLVDNHANPGGWSVTAEQLERHVTVELIKHEIAPVADNEKVCELRLADPATFRATPITALGRLANASQVLYITMGMDAGDVAPGAGLFQGYGAAYVRIVDVTSGKTLWPMNESLGYPVEYKTRPTLTFDNANPAAVRTKVQRALADQIVKLFYKYRPDEYEEM